MVYPFFTCIIEFVLDEEGRTNKYAETDNTTYYKWMYNIQNCEYLLPEVCDSHLNKNIKFAPVQVVEISVKADKIL